MIFLTMPIIRPARRGLAFQIYPQNYCYFEKNEITIRL
jgi:hypothetical protein